MLVEDLVLYLCTSELCTGTICACSCSLVVMITLWFALSTEAEGQAQLSWVAISRCSQ